MKIKFYFLLGLITFLTIIKCSSDGSNNNEPEQETFLCCTDSNPFAELNHDNLDQSAGEILPLGFFTPNGDLMHDLYYVENLYLYPNNSLTIYDLNDNIVFETQNQADYFDGTNQANGDELPFGTYKYKVVVENEQTFVEYGYLCLLRNYETEANGHSFIDCLTRPDGSYLEPDDEIQ